MRLGYNTNGFPHHRLEDALVLLAELGYESVAITLDCNALDPFADALSDQLNQIQRLLERLSLRSVIETGARFLLDPRRKHQPTLLSPDPHERERRFDFLRRAVDIARELRSDAVSFWSGAPTSAEPEQQHFNRLVEACQRLTDHAVLRNVQLAFEPEPGMFIDTLARFAPLHAAIGHPTFGLTIDVGHLHCLGEVPIADRLREWKAVLWNVHLEDMRKGVHEHLMFGDGEIEFIPVFRTLEEIGYSSGVHVELSRHGHDAVNAARTAITHLKRISMNQPASTKNSAS
jgi:sugar phosphate isomerase/epimerase